MPPGHARPSASDINKAINLRFEEVRRQEARLNVPAAEITQCTQLPAPTGHPNCLEQTRKSVLRYLIEAVQADRKKTVGIINPGDAWYKGGGLGVGTFKHQSVPLEETLCVAGHGGFKSLQEVVGGYPLGPGYPCERQLYSTNVHFRFGRDTLKQLCDVTGDAREQINAQRDLLLNAPFAASPGDSPAWHLVTVVAPDNRNSPGFDARVLYTSMLRQFAHALVNGQKHGVKTFLMMLPGSGLFAKTSKEPGAKAEPRYQQALACAAVDAVRYFGKGLHVVIPSHGEALDTLIEQYQTMHVVPEGVGARYNGKELAPSAITPPQSKPEELRMREMCGLRYGTAPTNFAKERQSYVASVLAPLIRDFSKVSIHRVYGVQPPVQGSQNYWFIRREEGVGRALVCIMKADKTREVYEVVFSRTALPELNAKVELAPTR